MGFWQTAKQILSPIADAADWASIGMKQIRDQKAAEDIKERANGEFEITEEELLKAKKNVQQCDEFVNILLGRKR